MQVTIDTLRDSQRVPNADGPVVVASAVLDFTMARLVIDDPGGGYARDQPISIAIEAPQECGGAPDGVAALVDISLGGAFDLAAMLSGGPFVQFPFGSVSYDLV